MKKLGTGESKLLSFHASLSRIYILDLYFMLATSDPLSSEIGEIFGLVPFSTVNAATVETLVGKKKLILCHLPIVYGNKHKRAQLKNFGRTKKVVIRVLSRLHSFKQYE